MTKKQQHVHRKAFVLTMVRKWKAFVAEVIPIIQPETFCSFLGVDGGGPISFFFFFNQVKSSVMEV